MILGKSAFLAAVVSLFCAGAAFAGIIRDDVPDANYLALGNDPSYASVGRVQSNIGFSSGVLIGSEWMLTAGHVVYSNFLANTPGSVSFHLGSSSYTGAQIYMAPGYVNSTPTNGNDLALVRLATPVNDVTPATLYGGSSEVGEVGTAVGYGKTGTGSGGMVSSPPTKRGGTNVIDEQGDWVINWSPNLLLADFDNPTNPSESWFGSSTPTAMEYMIAEGDSGSGLFIDLGNGPLLAGIGDFVWFDNDGINYSYGDGMVFTRVSGHMSWINATLAVPEPSSLVLAGIGLGVATITCIRRRNRASA